MRITFACIMMIDTHAHIYLKEFDADIDDVIARAAQVGVGKILLPNIDERSMAPLKSLAGRFPEVCYPMMGLHPCSVGPNYLEILERMKAEIDTGGYVAIGETGCDMFWDKTFRAEQMSALSIQTRWAIEKKLPLVIHAREAFDEIFEVLDTENHPDLTGVFHCFTGNLLQAEKILNYGRFMLGIGGVVTYKNSGLDKVLANISLDHLLLETDSPYLPPMPHRGQRNEPAFAALAAQKLADIKQTSLDEIARRTTENAKRLFKIN